MSNHKFSLLELADWPYRITELDQIALEQAIVDAHRLEGMIEGLVQSLKLERHRRLSGTSRVSR